MVLCIQWTLSNRAVMISTFESPPPQMYAVGGSSTLMKLHTSVVMVTTDRCNLATSVVMEAVVWWLVLATVAVETCLMT